MSNHTPLPWHLGSTDTTELVMGFRNRIECVIAELSGEIDIGQTEIEADAAFIVKAVNNHDALVTALTDVLRFCDVSSDNESDWERTVTAARGLIDLVSAPQENASE